MQVTAPKRILVATDLGPASETAVRFAGELAISLDATLTMFHAIAPLLFFDFGGWDPRSVQLASAKQMEGAVAELRALRASELGSTLRIETEVRDIYPVQGILQVAQEKDCDLIVLGTHAWGPVTSFFMGSVTQAVLHQSEIPVITVRPRGSEDHPRIRTILCPVNFSEAARAAVIYASMMAQATDAELHVLHLLETESDAEARSIADWLPSEISKRDIRTLTHRGDAAEEVVRYVGDHDIDLIVLGARHRRFVDTTVLGTTTERVIRHAPCAVMAITVRAIEDDQHEKGGVES